MHRVPFPQPQPSKTDRRQPRSRAPFQALGTVAGLVLLCLGPWSPWACAPAEPRDVAQDVLLITVDTLRADHLGLYGHDGASTPHFDDLGDRGRRYDAAFTPFPRTTPALGTLFTGRWPQIHGSREVGRPVHKGQVFLTHKLKELGFTTLGVSANGAAGESQNLDQGFDDMISAQELSRTRAVHITDAALKLMQAHGDAERLFLWAHYADPHFPYSPLQEEPDLDAVTAPDGTCAELVKYATAARHHTAHVVSNRDGRSEQALEDCRRAYDQEIVHVDRQIGRLLEAWAAARGGSLDNTLVIVTSDHGENMGEWHLYYQHGPNVHDAGLRVPLIFTGPGVEPGVDEAPVSLEDVMPTVLSLLGVKKKDRPESDGVDLSTGEHLASDSGEERLLFAESGSALLVESFRYVTSGRKGNRNCTNGPRYALCEDKDGTLRLFDHVEDPDLTQDLAPVEVEHARALLRIRRQWPPESSRQRSVRQGRYKLVEVPKLQGGYQRLLFDTEADPLETTDLAQQEPQRAAELGEALSQWTATLPVHSGLGELTPEEEQELRALGYID